MNEYKTYSNITKGLLDSIKVGDLIKINDWKKPLRVKGVSKDYFVMAGEGEYSVCEKKPWNKGPHNRMTPGMFHCGPDAWLFGAPFLFGNKLYNFKNSEVTQVYLESFELPESSENHSSISERNSIPITKIQIK